MKLGNLFGGGMGDIIGLMMGGEDKIKSIVGKLLGNPKMVNSVITGITDAWAEWEQKEGYQFTLTAKLETLPGKDSPELVVKVWAEEDKVLKPYKTFTKDNLHELINMFTNAGTDTTAGGKFELSAPTEQ